MKVILSRLNITINGKKYTSTVDLSSKKSEVSFENAVVSINTTDGNISMKMAVKDSVFVENLSLSGIIQTEQSGEDLSFLKEGFQSWSYSGALNSSEKQKKPLFKFVVANQENWTNPPLGKKGSVESDMYFALGDKNSNECLFVGQTAPFNQFVSYKFSFGKNEHKIEIIWDMFKKFKTKESYIFDSLVVQEGNINSLLEKYADDISKKVKFAYNSSLRTGWCSWYYYFTKISADCILSNLDHCVKNKIPYDFFQIDDGYQNAIGDWLILKPSFDGRMEEVVSKIKKAGYTPGLWLAPFIISKNSVNFNKEGWVLKNSKGKPVVAGYNPGWDGMYYALDITHPEVQNYIKEVFRTIYKEWGFTYIKLDFMYAACLPGERYDKSMTRAEVMSFGNKLIREQVGKKTTLLGCGMPISSAIGYMDAMRISSDVAPYWKPRLFDSIANSDSNVETRGALRNSSVRSFMDKRFWINDPDCLMLRTVNTKLTVEERETLYNLIMVFGGMLVTSDDMSLYGKEEYDIVKKAIALFKKTHKGFVSSLDILKQRVPEIVYNDTGYMVVSNFDESPKVKILEPSLFASLKSKPKKIKCIKTGTVYDCTKNIELNIGVHHSYFFELLKK